MYVCPHELLTLIPTLLFLFLFSLQETKKQSKKMKGSFVCLLLLILISFMFSATASRSSGWMKTEAALPEIHFQDVIETMGYVEKRGYDETITRRIDLENADYDGTGANDRHEPKPPGRA